MNERCTDVHKMAISVVMVPAIAFLNNNWRIVGFHNYRSGSSLDENRLNDLALQHHWWGVMEDYLTFCDRSHYRSLNESDCVGCWHNYSRGYHTVCDGPCI